MPQGEFGPHQCYQKAGLGQPPPASFLSSYFVPRNRSPFYLLGQRIEWVVHFHLRMLTSSQSFNTELYFWFLFLSFFPSRIYSSLSPSTFLGLLMISSLANSVFSFCYLLRPDLSNLDSISPPPIPLDTFLLFSSLFFFSRYFVSYLVPVFIPYLSGFSFPVSCLRVYFLCHCCPCCLYSQFTQRDTFILFLLVLCLFLEF